MYKCICDKSQGENRLTGTFLTCPLLVGALEGVDLEVPIHQQVSCFMESPVHVSC